jgi:hypothetical protein
LGPKIWRCVAAALLVSLTGCGLVPRSDAKQDTGISSGAICEDTNGEAVPRDKCDLSKVKLLAVCRQELPEQAIWTFAFKNQTSHWVDGRLQRESTKELVDVAGIEPGTSTFGYETTKEAPAFKITLVVVHSGGQVEKIAEASATTARCADGDGKLVDCQNPKLTGQEVKITFTLDKGEIFSPVIGVENAAQDEADPLERVAHGVYAGDLAFAPAFYSGLEYTPGASVTKVEVSGVSC